MKVFLDSIQSKMEENLAKMDEECVAKLAFSIWDFRFLGFKMSFYCEIMKFKVFRRNVNAQFCKKNEETWSIVEREITATGWRKETI